MKSRKEKSIFTFTEKELLFQCELEAEGRKWSEKKKKSHSSSSLEKSPRLLTSTRETLFV